MLQKVRKQGIRFWDERTFWHEMIYKSLIPTFGSLHEMIYNSLIPTFDKPTVQLNSKLTLECVSLASTRKVCNITREIVVSA